MVTSFARKLPVYGLILDESATYSTEAHASPWIYPQHQINPDTGENPYPDNYLGERVKKDKVWSGSSEGILQKTGMDNGNSPATEGVQVFLKKNPKAEMMIIEMEKDSVINIGGKTTVERYLDAGSAIDEKRVHYIKVPGGHGSTSPDEIKAIRKFLS